MFTLVTDRSKYYRVKRRQSPGEIESTLNTPVRGCAFAGRIINIPAEKLTLYSARVGDTYAEVAKKFGTDEECLRRLNADKPVYPTCKIFVPCK